MCACGRFEAVPVLALCTRPQDISLTPICHRRRYEAACTSPAHRQMEMQMDMRTCPCPCTWVCACIPSCWEAWESVLRGRRERFAGGGRRGDRACSRVARKAPLERARRADDPSPYWPPPRRRGGACCHHLLSGRRTPVSRRSRCARRPSAPRARGFAGRHWAHRGCCCYRWRRGVRPRRSPV